VAMQEMCLGGCTDNVYCSSSCAEADWASCHSLLCSGPPAKDTEWSRNQTDYSRSSSTPEQASMSRYIACNNVTISYRIGCSA